LQGLAEMEHHGPKSLLVYGLPLLLGLSQNELPEERDGKRVLAVPALAHKTDLAECREHLVHMARAERPGQGFHCSAVSSPV